MPDENAAPIRVRHVLVVLRSLVLFVGGIAAWMTAALGLGYACGGYGVVAWVLGWALIFLVWMCASIEAAKEADTDVR